MFMPIISKYTFFGIQAGYMRAIYKDTKCVQGHAILMPGTQLRG